MLERAVVSTRRAVLMMLKEKQVLKELSEIDLDELEYIDLDNIDEMLVYFRFDFQKEYEIKWGIRAWHESDGAMFACAGYRNHTALNLVEDNWTLLKSRDMLPAALIAALIGCKVNNSLWPVPLLEGLLDRCVEDSGLDALRSCGNDPGYIAPDAKVTVYRGVSGVGKFRRIRGMSWTDSLDVACWFAVRDVSDWSSARDVNDDPAVYTAKVPMSSVYCYTDERGEQEYIVRPKRPQRMDISIEEIKQRAREHARRIVRSESDML